MINSFNKIISSIKHRGLINTAKSVYHKLDFESSCRFTALKLGVQKSLRKDILIVNHGKYKFNYYGGGDRAEILYHTFWHKMFDDELKKIKDYVKKGDSVIDVGGNMGFFTLILNEMVGDSGKIYSFEPSKRLCKKLTSTVEINNLRNVQIVNIALGEKDGSTSLYFNPKQSGLSSIVSREKDEYIVEEITITTLDNFSKKIPNRISFIKIDTEGYEPQVLCGAKETIMRDKPAIYIELGGEHLESSIEALNILKELGYQCEAENIDLKKIPAGVNFIAVPEQFRK